MGVDAAAIATGLGPHGVANGLEVLESVELGEDMVEDEGHLLLLRETVEDAGFEVLEGVVCGGQECEALGGAVRLGYDLVANLGGGEEAE